MHLAAATNMPRFSAPYWQSRELKAASCPKIPSRRRSADLCYIVSFADVMFRYRLNPGMEAGDYCHRLHLRNWIKLTWCTFTRWLTGLTFRIGWRPCHLEWVL